MVDTAWIQSIFVSIQRQKAWNNPGLFTYLWVLACLLYFRNNYKSSAKMPDYKRLYRVIKPTKGAGSFEHFWTEHSRAWISKNNLKLLRSLEFVRNYFEILKYPRPDPEDVTTYLSRSVIVKLSRCISGGSIEAVGIPFKEVVQKCFESGQATPFGFLLHKLDAKLSSKSWKVPNTRQKETGTAF